MNCELSLPLEQMGEPSTEGWPEYEDVLLFGDKQNKNKPPPKIRGGQFVKREEKKFPKLIIRLPWQPKQPKPKP